MAEESICKWIWICCPWCSIWHWTSLSVALCNVYAKSDYLFRCYPNQNKIIIYELCESWLFFSGSYHANWPWKHKYCHVIPLFTELLICLAQWLSLNVFFHSLLQFLGQHGIMFIGHLHIDTEVNKMNPVLEGTTVANNPLWTVCGLPLNYSW